MARVAKSLEAFSRELAEAQMLGVWELDRYLENAVGGPKAASAAHIWHWRDVYPRLMEACEVLPESFTARRALSARNPGLRMGATHTLGASIQVIRSGETAWAHRHTINAVRFVIQGGPGVATVVDGEACPMEDYDLVLTPGWSWHDHHNGEERPAIWLDSLDMGIVAALNQTFYETYGEQAQPERATPGEHLRERTGLVRPVWEQPQRERLPMRYRWRDVEPRLQALADQPGSPFDGILLEYVNPMTGGSVLRTMGCWLQLLRPGEQTRPHRRTSSHIYFVVRGQGTTVVGDQELAWGQHDLFVVPNWTWHHHVNRSAAEQAILFSVNDIPTLEALGYYREEPENSLRMAPTPAIPADLARAPSREAR
jgi:1-hydroxy-2-naphthoate dioxygenase